MKVFQNLRAAFLLARSMKRIADALEEQNRIRKLELAEAGITIPEPGKKWTKKESEVEVTYGEMDTDEDQQAMDEYREENTFG